MNVLILSCCTGEGHNSAAKAVMGELESRGVTCKITDPIAFSSDAAQKFVTNFYNNLIKKTPQAFGVMYRASEKASDMLSSTELISPAYYLNAGYAQKLLRYIDENDIDAVVCTHLFGMEAMTGLRKRFKRYIPSYGVMTDYTSYPFTGETDMDAYFSAHGELTEELVGKGVNREHIVPTGIPVKSAFNQRVEQAAAREQLGMPADKKVILIMTGGVGCEPMLKLCDAVVNAADDRVVTYMMIGRNEDMRQILTERYGESGALVPVGFTDQVGLYMNAADVLITKAGGLSSTEAAVANIPMVHVRAIPGCETYNVQFFSEHGLSLTAETDREAAAQALRLAFDEELARRMREAQKTVINPHAARDIADRVIADLEGADKE